MNAGPPEFKPEAPSGVVSERCSDAADAPAGQAGGTSSGALGGASGWTLAVLAAALTMGLLRFVRLGQWSLWLDEVFTWGDAHEAIGRDNALGYGVIRWTVDLLGGDPSEAALRLAPALAGYLAIPLTYWAFAPLGGGLRAATAALVLALSAWEIQWSQTARFYTMVQALGLLGGGLAIRGMLNQRALVTVMGIGVAGLGVFFHLQGALIAAAIGAAAFVFPPVQTPQAKRSVRLSFLALALPGLLVFPFAWSVFQKYVHKKAVDDPIAGVAHFALTTGSFVTPTIAAAALGAWLLALRRRDAIPSFVGAVAVLGGLTLACLAAMAKVSAQYAFGLFPWIAVLAAWPMGGPVSKGWESSKKPSGAPAARLSWLLILVAPLLSQSAVYFTVGNGQRAKWREAIEVVASRRKSTDVIVGAPAPVVEFYLTGGNETDVRHHDVVVQLDRFRPRPYEAIMREGRRAWFVVRNDYSLSLSKADRDSFAHFLSARCRMVENFPVHVEARDLSVTVWLYEP